MKGARTSDNCYGITSGSGIVCNSAKQDETEMWHQRLGHVNFNDLSRLSSSELIRGIPKLKKITSYVCELCHWKNKLSPHTRK